MKITIAVSSPFIRTFPKGCFLARRGGVNGPLTVIGPESSLSRRYHAMDLEGHGGPAIGDVFFYTEEEVRTRFVLIDAPVTLQNDY